MRIYEVSTPRSNRSHGTLAEARADLRQRIKEKEVDFRDITIDEIEVGTDKANILRLINMEGGTHVYLRQWGGTQRGGIALQEREEA